MTQRIRIRDLSAPHETTVVEPRELAIDASQAQLYAGYGTTPQALLPVRVWSSGIQYHALDLVGYAGNVYRCRGTVPVGAPPSNPDYWQPITGEAGVGIQWAMASEVEALAGTSNDVVMSPLRVDQAVDQAIAANNTTIGTALGPVITTIAENVITNELLPGESIDVAIDAAIAAAAPKLYFFDKAGDLAAVTIPVGTDVIYRLGYAQRGDHDITRFKRKVDAPTTAPVNNLAWERDAAGVHFVNDMPEIDGRTFGVKGGVRTSTVAGMTAGSFTLGATGMNFTVADVGKKIWATGFGTLDAFYNKDSQFSATILSITNVNNVLLDTAAITTASNQYLVVGWDDAVPIVNTCRASATLGRWAVLPPGDFVHIGSLSGVVGYSGFRLRGAGMTATRIIHAQLGSSTTTASQIAVTGGIAGGNYLTAPAVAGTNAIVVLSTTGLTAGNIVVLSAQDQPVPVYTTDYPGTPVASNYGEVNRIRSIDVPTKTILLETALLYSYNANLTAGLRSTLDRVDVGVEPSIRDVCLEHVSTSSNGAVNHVGFGRVLRPCLENVQFKHTGGQCVSMSSWIDGISHNTRFSFIGGADALDDDWGYGYSITGFCWNVIISNAIAWRCRHAVTFGGGLPYPGPHFIHISQFLAYGCRINFDTHQGARFVTFEDCHTGPGAVLFNVPTPNTFGVSFQMRAEDTKVISCTAAGSQIAFSAAYAKNIRFEICHGVDVDTGYNIINAPNCEVIGGSIRNYRVQGAKIWRQGSDLTTMPNIRFKGVTFFGNPTKQELSDPYTINYEPCTFALGYWDGTAYPPGNFQSHYEDSWSFEDITIHDAKKRWLGLPETGLVYGALKQNNVVCESFPLDQINGTAALTSGTMLMSAIDILKGTYVARLATMFAGAAVGQTNLWLSIWDWNWNWLGATNDILTVAPTPNVLTWLDVAVPFCVNHPGRHYIGIHQAAGTPSTVHAKTLASALMGLNPKRAGTSNTGLTGPASAPSISPATSTTSMQMRGGTMKFVTQAGKAFTPGMPIQIASNTAPANCMRCRVTQYSGTALSVDVYELVGSGTFAAWDITAPAKAAALTATPNWAYVAVG